MTFEDIYNEADAFYEGFEREYGVYMHMELDLSYVWHYIEQHINAGLEPEEVLESVKSVIIRAADEAAHQQEGNEEGE